MTELIDTVNNGETEVLVVPKGEFYGSDSKGNPIPEAIDEQVIDNLEAQLQGKELLVDKDHSSVKEGIDKDTSAMGWMHSFKKGVEGLWAKIRWTNIGRNLVENRVFRFLSPVFTLNGDKPTNMLNVALTNQPAFQEKAKPIINNQPTMETITMEMTKEELVQLIKDTIADLKKEQAVEKVEQEIKDENEVHDGIVESLEVKKEAIETGTMPADAINSASNTCGKTEEPVENECEKKDEVVKNEDTPEDAEQVSEVKEEVMEEVAEPVKEEVEEEKEEKKEEVIKLEALNSTPKTEGIDIVKNFAPTQTPTKGYAITTVVR